MSPGATIRVNRDLKGGAAIVGDSNQVTINTYNYPDLLPHGLTSAKFDNSKQLREIYRLTNRLDRERQVATLVERLEQLRAERQPLVLVFNGDDHQCHELLLSRFKEDTLPRSLRPLHGHGIHRMFLRWPETLEHLSDLHAELSRTLSRDLADEIGHEEITPTPDRINQDLRLLAGPVMIATEIGDSLWRHYGISAVDAYLDYWRNWPQLATGQHLFVFLCVTYKRSRWTRLISAIRLLLRRQSSTTNKVDTALQEFAEVYAPRLGDIKRTYAENWARSKAVERTGFETQVLLNNVRKLFDEAGVASGSDEVTMRYFYEMLPKLLDETQK